MTRNQELFALHVAELRRRAELSVRQLATKAAVSLALVYKAEQGERVISCDALRKVYRPLCPTPREWADTLMRWAIAQDSEEGLLYHAAASMETVVEEAGGQPGGWLDKVLRAAAGVSDADMVTLVDFIHEYRENPHARTLVRAFLQTKEELLRNPSGGGTHGTD
jgi:transcriptional regulator with XRE-family HTH domain